MEERAGAKGSQPDSQTRRLQVARRLGLDSAIGPVHSSVLSPLDVHCASSPSGHNPILSYPIPKTFKWALGWQATRLAV